MSQNKKKILISSGGTGGHMSPASALAAVLKERGHEVELATDIRGRKYENMFPDIPIHTLKAGTVGAGVLGKVKGVVNLFLGVLEAARLLKKFKPDCVIGFGGYPSVPSVFSAQMSNVPTGLHEQNATLGKANLYLMKKAKFIGLSLPVPEKDFKQDMLSKVHITGNPVRPEIIALQDHVYPNFDDKTDLNIFVMGGSLGATVFSEVVPKALSVLKDELKQRINVTQQCRDSDLESVREIYADHNINHHLASFFDDVAAEIKKAHLFIGRSGASTVAEINIAGRPAIYVPYPHHQDQQQKKNAQHVSDKGGAWIVTEDNFNETSLKEQIEMMFDNPETLSRAAARAKDCGIPDAAEKLADLVLEIS